VPIHLKSVENFVVQRHGSFRQLTVPERKILIHWAEVMVSMIQASWPVDTSYSRDGFFATITGSKRPFQIIIENRVGYVQWVHRAGTSRDPERALWRTLIPDVLASVQAQMLNEIRAEIIRTEADIKLGKLPSNRGLLRLPRGRGDGPENE